MHVYTWLSHLDIRIDQNTPLKKFHTLGAFEFYLACTRRWKGWINIWNFSLTFRAVSYKSAKSLEGLPICLPHSVLSVMSPLFDFEVVLPIRRLKSSGQVLEFWGCDFAQPYYLKGLTVAYVMWCPCVHVCLSKPEQLKRVIIIVVVCHLLCTRVTADWLLGEIISNLCYKINIISGLIVLYNSVIAITYQTCFINGTITGTGVYFIKSFYMKLFTQLCQSIRIVRHA